MKYGESSFDIFYLLVTIILGFTMLKKSKNSYGKLLAISTLILGFGDSFHLIPRILNYFIEADFTMALGIGKLVTSITMTVFYVLLYRFANSYYKLNNKKLSYTIYCLFILRIILCLLPQNAWLTNNSNVTMGIIRNVPFIIMGIIMIVIFYNNRNKLMRFKYIWLLILLSFAFYIPVAVAASVLPILGMLMLPKTICYLLMVEIFYQAINNNEISD